MTILSFLCPTTMQLKLNDKKLKIASPLSDQFSLAQLHIFGELYPKSTLLTILRTSHCQEFLDSHIYIDIIKINLPTFVKYLKN
jgi:hypothetical protein